MIGAGARRLAGAVALGAVFVGGSVATERALRPTFSGDIAPLVFDKCASCHRLGGVAPFALLSYEDVRDHAREIKRVTARRFMPPWRPAPGYAEYKNDRSLTREQIALFARWVDDGMERGDPRRMPAEPEWPSDWQLGTPDVIIPMPETYTLPADGTDVYRNFVIPSTIAGRHYVTAWELRPGTRTIHHAILNIDRFGLARRRDELDPGMGFGGMDTDDVQSADGFYLVWTPGMVPLPPSSNMGWLLDEHTDLVLQLHMQPTGKPETVRPTIALHLTDEAPTAKVFTLRIGDPPIDIPPGDADYVIRSQDTLPADVDVLGLFPHAHYLARKMRIWATLPDGRERVLLQIDDWDFAWQDDYAFAQPIALPAGTRLAMEFHYDNSTGNPRNPNHPPARVLGGPNSADEMGNVTFRLMPRDAAGMNRLRESKYRKWLMSSDTARNQYNLANVLVDEGKADEAIAHYRRATEENPLLAPAFFNLGNVLLERHDLDGAMAAFGGAIAAKPDFADAYVNLGNAAKQKGDAAGALAHYRAAVNADPRSAVAQNSLALSLDQSGDPAAAIAHFEAALAVDPNSWRSRSRYGDALRHAGRRGDAIAQYTRAVALSPDARDAARALADLQAP